jgi:hypothetical protein
MDPHQGRETVLVQGDAVNNCTLNLARSAQLGFDVYASLGYLNHKSANDRQKMDENTEMAPEASTTDKMGVLRFETVRRS